jgi:cyclic beta-1,2-glucan synthetase
MYRVGLEAILGFTKKGDSLSLNPRVPREWPGFSIDYRFGSALYAITVEWPGTLGDGEVEVSLDGAILEGPTIELRDDGARHEVVVRARKLAPV